MYTETTSGHNQNTLRRAERANTQTQQNTHTHRHIRDGVFTEIQFFDRSGISSVWHCRQFSIH